MSCVVEGNISKWLKLCRGDKSKFLYEKVFTIKKGMFKVSHWDNFRKFLVEKNFGLLGNPITAPIWLQILSMKKLKGLGGKYWQIQSILYFTSWNHFNVLDAILVGTILKWSISGIRNSRDFGASHQTIWPLVKMKRGLNKVLPSI